MKKETLREILKELGVSQAKYARLLGITSHTVGYWLKGRQNISGVAARMALLLRERPELVQVLQKLHEQQGIK